MLRRVEKCYKFTETISGRAVTFIREKCIARKNKKGSLGNYNPFIKQLKY
jgi:hypothetical protein